MSHYDTLGVAADATADEIKAAYRKQAKEHHPDREGGDEAKMQAVNQAYETLGDATKREHYDRTGSDTLSGPTAESTAASILLSLYQALCSDGTLQQGNISDNLMNLVAKRRDNLVHNEMLARREMVKLEKLAKRCVSKDNLLATVIQGRQNALQEQLKAVNHELEALTLLSEDLVSFMDLQPDPPLRTERQSYADLYNQNVLQQVYGEGPGGFRSRSRGNF